MSDLIDRQKAINVIERMRAYIGHNMERAVGAAFIEILDDVGEDIGRLPSIQFATDTNVGTKLGTNLAQLGTDCISRQAAINAYGDWYVEEGTEEGFIGTVKQLLEGLPSAQPERTCVNCGRTANNGGWYADGRTRCPIEEHYALPKDGYCHLWEKRNVTDDDYPERREE
jgi:hypothetical protein